MKRKMSLESRSGFTRSWPRERLALSLLVLVASLAAAQPRRKVIINQDCSGPGGSNLQTLLVMLQSPEVEVLGITVVTGDQWRDEEVAHMSCLSWKWRKRSSVKIAERTYEERAQALHC